MKKLDAEPRLQGESSPLITWARTVAQALNTFYDEFLALIERTKVVEAPTIFAAYLAANQAVTPATIGQVVFSVDEFDADAVHDVTTGKFTAKRAGFYQFETCITVSATSGSLSNVQLYLYKNGALLKRGPFSFVNNGTGIALCASFPRMYLALNDVVDVRMYVDGGALVSPVFMGGVSSTWWSGQFLRA